MTQETSEQATYVSVWDGGTAVRTACKYNRARNHVFDVESADVDGLETLEREYIELADGTEIDDFTLEGRD